MYLIFLRKSTKRKASYPKEPIPYFDGSELVERLNVPLDGHPSNMRGVYIDGYMYMFGQKDFKVKNLY